MKSMFAKNIKEKEILLIEKLHLCVKRQKECPSPDAAIGDFLKIANNYRMMILNEPRDIFANSDDGRKENYFKAIEVVELSRSLASKLKALESGVRKAGFRDPLDHQEIGAFDCVLWCACGSSDEMCVCGDVVRYDRLRRFSEKLHGVIDNLYGINNDSFNRKIEVIYSNLLFDLLKTSFDHGLRVVAYNDISKYGRRENSMFHAFLKIFEYCEYYDGVLDFSWRAVLSKEGVEDFSSTLSCRLNDIKNGKRKLTREVDYCIEEVGVNFYKFISKHWDGVRFRSDLPSFKRI